MTFAKSYPNLDKICDTPFIRILLGSTKIDAPRIIQNCNIGAIFEKAEKEIAAVVNSIRKELEDHLRSPAVKVALFYKQELEQKQRERDEVIRQYKRQIRERYTLVSVCYDDHYSAACEGPKMTLSQFSVLMQNAILDEAISFKIKPSISKPTVEIVNNQLVVTVPEVALKHSVA